MSKIIILQGFAKGVKNRAWLPSQQQMVEITLLPIQEALKVLGLNFKNTISLNIMFEGEKGIKVLNSSYRKKDKATNVLSFPFFENSNEMANYGNNVLEIGDICFCVKIIEKESRERLIAPYQHFCHLLIHAVLHLFLFDHDNEKAAQTMENIEIACLEKLNIANPYLVAE